MREVGTMQFSGPAHRGSRPDIGDTYSDTWVIAIKPGGCKLVAQGLNLATGGMLD